MIKKSIYIVSILMLMIVSVGTSQSINEESNIDTKNFDHLLNQNFQTDNAFLNKTFIDDNNVFINQIGSDNEVVVKTQSVNNNINLFQNGTQNKIYLDVIADNINETISQTGNFNYVLDYSTSGVENHNLVVSQTGNNQNLTWFGGNSLSENLQVNMQGESKTVIVRNFN